MHQYLYCFKYSIFSINRCQNCIMYKEIDPFEILSWKLLNDILHSNYVEKGQKICQWWQLLLYIGRQAQFIRDYWCTMNIENGESIESHALWTCTLNRWLSIIILYTTDFLFCSLEIEYKAIWYKTLSIYIA